jgi:hypothetical protein
VNFKRIMATAVTVVCLTSVVAAAGTATAAGGPPSIAAGPAFGFIPSHNANHQKAQGGHLFLLGWNGGPVMHSTSVAPIFWGSRWNTSFTGDKITGLDYVYSHIGGTAYARTNSEYYDGAGNVNTTSISKLGDSSDYSATPSGAPSTSQVLAEVAKMTNNKPVANAYYPVYSDQPRGRAGYCAWHSSGTINGTQVQFGFFFNLDGDPGCDPQAPSSLGHSQGLSALANVTGHELSEMLTDPQLNAWYDQKGAENSDKCAWTFNGNVTIGAQSWKIQGNWSNAAALANSGYANGGCIQTA